MKLLKEAVNQTAYLKAGVLGFQGSGKTFTSCELAIRLATLEGKKRVAFYDTETGSDWVIPKFKAAGLSLDVLKSRSLVDLVEVMSEVEKSPDHNVLIIDSISHVWQDVLSSYLKKSKREFIGIDDWGKLKPQWRESFSDNYVNSRCHIIMCGRAAHEYEDIINDRGKRQSVKTGTKMRVEGETGYEPSLLIEMESVKNEGAKKSKVFIHRATILKDRSHLIQGKVFDNPTAKEFEPVIKFLNIGGEHIGVDTSRNSESLFQSPERQWDERRKKRQIAIEELQDALTLAGLGGTAANVKERRTRLLQDLFGKSSQTYIEEEATMDQILLAIEHIRKMAEGNNGNSSNPVAGGNTEAKARNGGSGSKEALQPTGATDLNLREPGAKAQQIEQTVQSAQG